MRRAAERIKKNAVLAYKEPQRPVLVYMAGCALHRAVSSHYAQVGYDINALVKPIRVFWPPQALNSRAGEGGGWR